MAHKQSCDTCGAENEHLFDVTKDGTTYTFDSFECAIHKVAPRCAHCDCAVIGHGYAEGGEVYCCQHCAEG